jgi:uncharacterized protein (TIGR03437 family)
MRNFSRATMALAAGSLPVLLYALNSGPDARHTGAPGDQPLACATAGCHTAPLSSGPINFHGGNVTATFSSGSTYTPGGGPITITVNVNDPSPSNANHGFQMTARLASNLVNGQAGRFSFAGGSGVLVICENSTLRIGDCPQSAPVEFIEHNAKRTGSWTFTWTPPATNVGNVHFYVAGNAVNNNGSPDEGDHVYTASYVLTPAGGCTTPVIDGIQSAGEFGARQDFSTGSWLEIYGLTMMNLSSTTADWNGKFNGDQAPTVVDGVSASVNGQPAAVWFVSPGQMNVQAPGLEATGPVAITVTDSRLSGCPQTSAPSILTQRPTAPGLLAKTAWKIGGKQYLTAFFPDFTTFVGNIPGFPSRPVKSGERIVTFGIGFGPTNPFFTPGIIVSGTNRITGDLQVTIGGVPLPEANIEYAGLTPGFIGLYQFNLLIPTLPDGDHQVVVTLNGEPLPQTLYITVQN